MALTFFQGPAGSGKSTRMLTRLIREAEAHPERRFFVLVPEQVSFQTQLLLTRLHPRGGMLNIDVLSLNHLAYRVLEETGTPVRELLGDDGKLLLLRRIARKEGNALPYLRERLSRPGQIADVKSILSELWLYHTDTDALGAHLPAFSAPLREKLQDILRLSDIFRDYCKEHYDTSEELPLRMASCIPRSGMLAGSTIALDGFTGFTPIQLPVLSALLACARDLYVTVTAEADADPGSEVPEEDLFAMGHRMAAQLLALAEAQSVPVTEPERIFPAPESRLGDSPALSHLERNLFRPEAKPFSGDTDSIRIAGYDTPAKEARAIARRIRALVRTEGIRYGRIAVVTGDIATYGDLLVRAFEEIRIPCFLDDTRSILNLPASELLRAAVQIAASGWQEEAVLRLLRTGLCGIPEDDVDRLENYALALGIRGRSRWQEPFTFRYRGEDPEEVPHLNEVRARLTELLDPVIDAFSASGGTARDKSLALYELLNTLSVQEKLAHRAEELREDGRTALAAEIDRLYPLLIGILDQIVAVLGELPVSMQEYRDLLDTALTETRLGLIPSDRDAVTIADIERSRLPDIDCLFFAGTNDGIIPKTGSGGGILSESDRTALAKEGFPLSPDSRELLYRQRFYLYLALTKPRRHLCLTYAGSGTGGEALRPAYLIRTLMTIFPAMRAEADPPLPLLFAETEREAIRLIPGALTASLSDEENRTFLSLLAALKEDADTEPILVRVREASLHRVPKDAIGAATARALYGTVLKNSASRLELFASCAFRHFASYGLSLAERAVFTYTGADRGSLLHEALERYSRHIAESGRSFTDVSDAEIDRYAAEFLRETAEQYGNRLLFDSARSRNEIRRLTALLARTIRVLTAQIAMGDFVPAAFEVPFRSEKTLLPAPDIRGEMILTGRIDRIDLFTDDTQTLVRVLDYKSGRASFDPARVVSGLSLQLPLYLRAALSFAAEQTGKSARPAGLFYYHIDDPLLEYVPEEDPESREARRLGELKMKGLANASSDVLPHLDRAVSGPGTKSNLMSVSITKTGAIDQRSGAVPEEDLLALGAFAEDKAAALASGILSGQVATDPYAAGSESACDYCPYRSVCGFDEHLPGGTYRSLSAKDRDTVWACIRGEEEISE